MKPSSHYLKAFPAGLDSEEKKGKSAQDGEKA